MTAGRARIVQAVVFDHYLRKDLLSKLIRLLTRVSEGQLNNPIVQTVLKTIRVVGKQGVLNDRRKRRDSVKLEAPSCTLSGAVGTQ